MSDKPGLSHGRIAPKPLSKVQRVRLPLLRGNGCPGLRCPRTKTPYDLVLGGLNPVTPKHLPGLPQKRNWTQRVFTALL